MELTSLSKEELLELEAKVQEELLVRKKKEYKVRSGKKVDLKAFYDEMIRLRDNSPDLSWYIMEAEKKSSLEIELTNREKYPCPNCGGFTLLPEHVGAAYSAITCGGCGFESPNKYGINAEDAWEKFINWLKEDGYITEER